MLRFRRALRPRTGALRALGSGSAGVGARRRVPVSERALQPCSCSGKERLLGSGSCSLPPAFGLETECPIAGNYMMGFWFKTGWVEGEASRAGIPGGMSPWSSRSLAVSREGP